MAPLNLVSLRTNYEAICLYNNIDDGIIDSFRIKKYVIKKLYVNKIRYTNAVVNYIYDDGANIL